MSYKIPKSKWFRIMAKCGGRCWFCGRKAASLDHAVPRSRGGGNDEANLLPACLACNGLKDDQTVAEFRKYVKVLAIRKLMHMGIYPSKKLRIVFFGEGNDSPLIPH